MADAALGPLLEFRCTSQTCARTHHLCRSVQVYILLLPMLDTLVKLTGEGLSSPFQMSRRQGSGLLPQHDSLSGASLAIQRLHERTQLPGSRSSGERDGVSSVMDPS
jgi:hypothetical protein